MILTRIISYTHTQIGLTKYKLDGVPQSLTAEQQIQENAKKAGYAEQVKFDPNSLGATLKEQRARIVKENMGVTDLTQGFDQSTFFRNHNTIQHNKKLGRKTGTSLGK